MFNVCLCRECVFVNARICYTLSERRAMCQSVNRQISVGAQLIRRWVQSASANRMRAHVVQTERDLFTCNLKFAQVFYEFCPEKRFSVLIAVADVFAST